ncbi:MAG: hypothetical protein ABII89_01405 [Candidatus Omnitrophota bacterium]
MKIRWLTVIITVVIAGVLVAILAHKKSVKKEIATAPNVPPAMIAAEISAAIDYGKKHKDDLLVDFKKPWTVFLGYDHGKGSATIFTPYYCLALMARNSARDNSEMDTEVICRLCAEKHKEPYFEVTLYSMNDFFDRDYKAVILKDDREVPILETFHRGYDMAREYMIFSQQKLYFSADILSDKGKITLRIIKPEEAPLDFVFDLENIP